MIETVNDRDFLWSAIAILQRSRVDWMEARFDLRIDPRLGWIATHKAPKVD